MQSIFIYRGKKYMHVSDGAYGDVCDDVFSWP